MDHEEAPPFFARSGYFLCSGVGATKVDDAEDAEHDIGQPRAEPGAEDAIPAESLAGLNAAIKDEAD